MTNETGVRVDFSEREAPFLLVSVGSAQALNAGVSWLRALHVPFVWKTMILFGELRL